MAEPSTGGEYVHGTHETEQTRLALMNQILNARTLAEIPLRPGDRVLDIGSGLGQMSIAMARVVGATGRVVGIERSADQIAKASSGLREAGQAARDLAGVEFRQGDGLRPPLLESELGSFDVAFTRFLLEHVPDPLAVVEQMVRSVRPGGQIVLADDDHDVLRLQPEPEGFARVWRAYMELYTTVGNDPAVGRRLVQLLHQAGASPTRNAWVWFGSCSGDPMFGAIVANLAGVLCGAADRMVSEGLIDADAMRRFCDAPLKEFAARPDAAVWFAMSLAVGVRNN